MFHVSRSKIILRIQIILWFLKNNSFLVAEAQDDSEGQSGDYCISETFQPRCMHNEVIVLKRSSYGRMRIGRCITAAEIETLRSGYIGCSADVLPLLDRKCSGNTECEIRVAEISIENIKPCPPGLNVYLEVTYDCISIVDGRRSCVADVLANPIHLMSSSSCGTKSEPWIVNAPAGQKLQIGLLQFMASEEGRDSCQNGGVVVDKVAKRNVSICVGGTQREKELYLSSGNSIQIVFNQPHAVESSDIDQQVILRLQAVGCSDIIPPSDGYAKRNGDAIVVGCYASRKTWHLNCEEGKWIGVIGNCSQAVDIPDQPEMSGPEIEKFRNEQVVAIVALSGITFAICLTIVCLGMVCLRRLRVKSKAKQDYKTLNYCVSSPTDRRFQHNMVNDFGGNDGSNTQQLPLYSVFVGDGDIISSSISATQNPRC